LSGYSNQARLAYILKHINIGITTNHSGAGDNFDRARHNPADFQPT
jgi:hypothetical protein